MPMKLSIALFTAIVLVGSKTSPAGAAPALAPQRVLFIGNSYTSFNNLPQIYQRIAASAGHAPRQLKAAMPDGMTLHAHLVYPATLSLIDEGNWDVVVVQAQSQEAAASEQISEVRSNFLEGATGLYDRIKGRSPHAKIIFYETWARHTAYWNEPGADSSVGSSAVDMQARIRKWYQKAVAERKDFIIAPVGEAWELNYKNPKAVRLHQSDNSHPAFNGSYLAALVIYGTIYHTQKVNVSYAGGLSPAQALYLQTIASQAMRIYNSP